MFLTLVPKSFFLLVFLLFLKRQFCRVHNCSCPVNFSIQNIDHCSSSRVASLMLPLPCLSTSLHTYALVALQLGHTLSFFRCQIEKLLVRRFKFEKLFFT